MTGERLMTVPETARFLNISEPSLRNLMCRRSIPFFHVGERRVRFDPQELRRWLDERRVPAVEMTR
ncbi:MAG TPA: helix-turn-helix domain-containing protein [bacterium]|nr:helix-turn-helix domain-containing protein [bacterium]